MHTTRCTKCPKTFTKSNQASAEMALACHFARKHGNNQGNPQLRYQRRAEIGPRTGKPLRPYVKRTQVVVEPKPERPGNRQPAESPKQITINFCPGCGCDLHKVALALVLARQIKQQ